MAKIPSIVQAASSGHLTEVQNLINEGCYIDKRNVAGLSALMSAAQSGHAGCVSALLAARADTNAYDAKSQTALILAAHNGREACASLLVEAGAYLDAQNAWGNTPLIAASSQKHLACVVFLLGARATVDITNKHSKDALALAKQMKHGEIATLLGTALDTQRLVLTLHVDLPCPEEESVELRLTDMAGSEEAACTSKLTVQFAIAKAELARQIGTDNYQLLLPSGQVLSDMDDMRPMSHFVDICQSAQPDSCL